MTSEQERMLVIKGEVLEQQATLTLTEFCRDYALDSSWVVELVEEGILEPEGTGQEQWRFSGECCRRVSVVRRLQRDLGVNLSGAALALDLLEEVQALRRTLRQLS